MVIKLSYSQIYLLMFFVGCCMLSACGSGQTTSQSAFPNNNTSPVLAFKLSAVSVGSSDLVAHYDFDQGVGTAISDISGNSYNGIAMPWNEASQSGTVWTAGQYGNALTFSEGGRITIDSNSTLDAQLGQNGLSISLWFQLHDTAINGYIRLVSKKPDWEQAEGFELDFNPSNGQIHLVCQGANFIEGVVPPASINNQWHHIVATLDGNTGSIRFDNQDITTISTVPLSGILPCPHQLTIGALANGSADPVAAFQGSIDDLRLYGRALTVSEQQQLYNDSANTAQTNELIAWWTADDSGSTIVDSSGYGHHGTASNMLMDTGFINGALHGDNADARVVVGGADTLALQGSMTLSAWVQVDDPSQNYHMRILSKKVEDNDLGGYELAYYPAGNNLIFNGQGGLTAAVSVDLGSDWNLLTVSVDDKNVTFYRNGQEIGTGTIAGLLQNDTPVYLGHRAREDATLPGAWLGALDDIRIYNYALDADAVSSVYGETLRLAENPTTAYAGLLYEYYEGAWSQLPDFDSITALATHAVNNFTLTPRLRDDNFAFRYTGFIEIIEHGEYTFYTSSDDGSQLYIGNTLVVDNDGLHSTTQRSGSIRLQAGLHAIRTTYFERGGQEVLDVTWSGPNFSETSIPDLRLFRDGGIDFPPIVSASMQNNATVSTVGTLLLATVAVSDSEDGTIPDGSIVWISSLDGALTTGTQFDVSALSIGDHIITISVTDSQGQSASDTLSISMLSDNDLRIADTPGAIVNGIDYGYYEGSWSVLPDFAQLNPVEAGITALPDLSQRLLEDNYGFRYTAYISAPSDGIYTFFLNSDDGSRLRIGSTVVVDNDGLHGARLRSGSIGLQAGLHAIEITFFERTGAAVLDVQWSGPSIAQEDIPATQFFRLDANQVPQVSITSPVTVSAAQAGVMVNFSAQAFDVEDASLPANQWSWESNIDGALGTGENLAIDTLSLGLHTIRVNVSDSDGAVGSDNILLVVNTTVTGGITREVWLGIGGTRVSDLTSSAKYAGAADIEDTLDSFEGPINWENNYGTRLRAYIHAPVSGSYTFWISSDDRSELYLSTDDSAAQKTLIANVPGWTTSRLWDKYSQQKSISINLIAGQRYYVEALQKEGGGADNISVSWEFPGMTQTIIDGSFLSPFVPVGNN